MRIHAGWGLSCLLRRLSRYRSWFSAISVLVYQGGIALLATYLAPFLSDPVIAELTFHRRYSDFGIGLNMLGLTKLRVGNMLPAMIIALLLTISLGVSRRRSRKQAGLTDITQT